MKVTYKITYHNLKIYVGVDLTGTLRYFGVPNPAQSRAGARVHAKGRARVTRDGGVAGRLVLSAVIG